MATASDMEYYIVLRAVKILSDVLHIFFKRGYQKTFSAVTFGVSDATKPQISSSRMTRQTSRIREKRRDVRTEIHFASLGLVDTLLFVGIFSTQMHLEIIFQKYILYFILA